jgi:hypothetical protein
VAGGSDGAVQVGRRCAGVSNPSVGSRSVLFDWSLAMRRFGTGPGGGSGSSGSEHLLSMSIHRHPISFLRTRPVPLRFSGCEMMNAALSL